MQLEETKSFDREKFNHYVAAEPGGSFLQSWEWGEWQEQLGRKVYRFLVKDNLDVLGALQIIVMPLAGGKCYLYMPHGPVIRDSRFDLRGWKVLVHELQQKFPAAVFLRVEPKHRFSALSSLGKKVVNIQPAKTLIVDLSKSEDELLGEMHPKTRYNIKVALKHGVEVVDEFNVPVEQGVNTENALQLLSQTSERQGFASHKVSYYRNMVNFFAGRSGLEFRLHIYKAMYEDKLLASALMVDFGPMRTYLFGGSSHEHKNVMAPYLLHWQAMQSAKAEGKKSYDFWGIETSKGDVPGFVRFKLGFGGREEQYPGAYDIVFRPLFYRGYAIMRAVNRWIR